MSATHSAHSRFFWRSAAMFGVLDSDYLFQEVNSAWENLLGLSTGQLLAKNFLDFIHSEDRPAIAYYFEQLQSGMATVTFSVRFRHFNGNYHTVLWTINNAASVEYAYYVVGMDITGREQPMVADEMISVLQEGVILQYANGTIGASNPSAERILGLKAENMMGWTLVDPDWQLIREDGEIFPTETHPAICTLRTGQPFSDVVMGIVKPDEEDQVTWIRVNAHPLWRDDVTTPYAVVISFSDITAYKEKEENLRQTQTNIEPSPADIEEKSNKEYDFWDWNLSDNSIQFSARWKSMLGYGKEELPNHIDTWQQRIHPADYKKVMADIHNHLDGMTDSCENTHRLQHRDGSYRWISCRAVAVRDRMGNPQHMVGVHIDVTSSHQKEENLQDNEKKYRQILEAESDAILLIEADTTKIIDTNKSASQLYGYGREQLLGMQCIDLSAQPDKLTTELAKNTKVTLQHYFRRRDETAFTAETTLSPFVLKGKQVAVVGIRDLSQQQQLETALWESEAKYRQLFEAASNPTVVFDANTQRFFDVNHAAINLYGFSKEEFLQMTTEDVSAEPIKKRGAFTSSSRKVQVIPLRWHRHKDGSVFPVEISSGNTYLFKGRSLICATIRDITERKAAEEAIRKERDFVNTLVQASPAFFVAINPNMTVRMMNKAMLNALGYELEEIINEDFLSNFITAEEQPVVSSEFETLRRTMQPSLMETHILTHSGKLLLLEWHSRAIIKADGELDYIFGVGIDVTERKKAQGHLRLFKSIIESSEEAIYICSPEGQFVYVNPAHEKLFGYFAREIKQKYYQDFYTPDALETLKRDILPALENGGSWEGELAMLDNQGNVFPVWERVGAIRDTEQNILFSFALLHDISERQRMWETLRRQWEEHQMIFNTIPAMLWYRNADNHLIRSNTLANETFGDTDNIKRYISCEEVLETEQAQHDIIVSYQDQWGEEFWLHIDKIPCFDNKHQLVGALVCALDITDYKRTQLSLEASEERMYLVVENMPVMLNALDEEGNILMWNRASEDITGYSAEEIIHNDKAMETLYPDPEERRHMMTKWYTFSESENYWEARITCKDGHLKTIAWRSVANQYQVPGWHAWHIGQDITQRKQIEHTFQEGEALLASVFDTVKLGMCLTDDRGRFLQVNRTYAIMYGYRKEELIGQPFTLILPTETHSDAVREYYSLLMTHDEPVFAARREEKHKNGQTFEVNILASRVILEDRRRLLLSVVSKVK